MRRKKKDVNVVRIILWISRLAGLGATILGLSHWLGWFSLIAFHMVFGLLVAFTLFVLSGIMIFTKRMKLPGILGMLFACLLPVFGIIQSTLLIGDVHWLIQVIHLLVGIIAVAITQILGRRYELFKQATAKARAVAQNEWEI
jgi:hypothetical protein